MKTEAKIIKEKKQFSKIVPTKPREISRKYKKRCSDMSMEVKLPALLGNIEILSDIPTEQPIDRRRDRVIGKLQFQ